MLRGRDVRFPWQKRGPDPAEIRVRLLDALVADPLDHARVDVIRLLELWGFARHTFSTEGGWVAEAWVPDLAPELLTHVPQQDPVHPDVTLIVAERISTLRLRFRDDQIPTGSEENAKHRRERHEG